VAAVGHRKQGGSTAARKGAAQSNGARVAGTRKGAANGADSEVSRAELEKLLAALHAARDGQFNVRLPVRGKGLAAELNRAFNEVADRREALTKEVARVGRVIGREGRMTERASAGSAGGRWSETINSLNTLIDDLVRPTTEVARVIDAVAQGDLSQKMALKIEGQPVKGEFLRIGTTVNAMVDQLSSFADEVTRVAREVGTDGKLGGQAKVRGVSGVWKDITDNVNTLAANLTTQVRNIAEVTTAVANGDLSKKITVDVRGEVAELKNTVNTMVDQLSSFADEVTRVAREVGEEGTLGGQAQVKGVSGTWKDLTESVNGLASNLTGQVRNIAAVTTAVANGDLSKKITVDVKGEVLELKETINTMVDQLRAFSAEVTRVAKEVGTEGKLGGQANVEGVSGVWKDLTDNVNTLAGNLTDQVRNIAEVTTAVATGDLSKKITVDVRGEVLQLKDTINTMVDQLRSFASEVTRVAREVGTEGRLGGQANVEGVSGVWKDLTDNVNTLAGNLTTQVRNIAQVTTAVANGDLTKKITVDVQGEVAELKETINTMVDQLSAFAAEVTRVAREVGTEGRLGGQAQVEGVSGTWRGLTESVNFMASSLTEQVRNIAEVTTAVANGDLSKKVTVHVKGEVLQLKDTINTMVDQLGSFADEVTRVAREVGTEGRLGGQAEVEDVSGTWRALTESVNGMASNLTDQVRNIAEVATAVAKGDLTQKITVDARGEILELKNTLNTMVDQLSTFADEVTRVAREVGTEGRLGGQAEVEGVSGTWRGLTENVNQMANNLTSQVRNIAQVATAVAKGDLSQKITVEARGEILELKNTLNTMVDQLSAFADEVTRVAREVGTEGRLGGQAQVEGVSGTWRGLTESVNFMASSLTEQVRNIAEVTTAVANGDLSKKVTVDVKGEISELKNTINTMVDQLGSFADEVTRVAREVGTEGKLGGQAEVKGVSGTWKDLTDNVNTLAGNLTDQVRNIAGVTTAVAKGDLTQKITVDARGEVLQLKDTINTMVDQLSAFAAEVTRVAREVGTEGVLGGQAEVEGVSGTWRDLTESVNGMASNLTGQVRNIADVTTAVANGDLSKKITVDVRGEVLELKETVNTMVDQLRAFSAEVTRVAREVGTEGRLGGQASVEGVSGVWKDLTDNVNFMAASLTEQVRNIAQVTTAVANGDLSKTVTVDVKGEVLELKDTINVMVDQLSSFADEVTRVAREVGTEGKLGGQANVKGVSGTWKDLTDSVNGLASNLTGQVRNIAEVTTAVAKGDLSQKITVDARGEILQLKNTVNIMVDQLSSFAGELTRVAKEVGTEGVLGGQANVEGVSGVWKDLTDNFNQLAASLTTQVRAIADVSTAVTEGDLTREVTVEAKGEVDALKQNVNQMIANLRETTERNAEQDWLNSNLARFSGMMQGQRDLQTVSRVIMSELTPLVGAGHGAFFLAEDVDEGDPELQLIASYGYKKRKNVANRFKLGESLVGQAALERQSILIAEPPEDYVRVTSALGEAAPRNIVVMPVLFEDQVMAVMELASFQAFSDVQRGFLEQLGETIGIVINTIQATMRTEELLRQSQGLTQELQERSEELQSQQEELKRANSELEQQAQTLKASEELLQTQQEELQQTNEELEEKAQLLEEQNRRIEIKNREIELARAALQERAEQLALSSKYKSEFLANMSHELRTPLNSLLILAKLLSENADKNLTDKQIEFAQTIHQAGADLLELINDILDLSKVEAGKMDVYIAEVVLGDLRDYVERTFRPMAEDKGLELAVEIVGASVPPTVVTDEQRLQQVLKNLLSNAVKFTEEGGVTMRIEVAPETTQFATPALSTADTVLAFSVSDSGIGIPEDKLRLIFEAFQQADGTTSRKYGGTGLGLSISREIARLLGGEIRVHSTPGTGSTFTLYMPVQFTPLGHGDADVVALEARLDQLVREGESLVAEGTVLLDPGGEVRVPEIDLDPTLLLPSEVPDDREDVMEGDRIVLIVEDDPVFARTVLDGARDRGFKGLVALRGDAGLALAREFKPDAIVLDMNLPVMDGWTVLDHLKHHPATRHIPVHIVSAGELEGKANALRAGAVAFLQKPLEKEHLDETFQQIASFIDRGVKSLLVVEDDDDQRNSIVELVGSGDDVDVTAVGTSEEAIAQLEEKHFDCMVLDLKLPDTTGFKLLEQLKKDERFATLPVIVYTGQDLTRREETRLKKYAETIIVKDARSPERLLDETSLFLHRVEARLPQAKRRMLEQLHSVEEVFNGKKVLIVDDDVRNVFALTSVLEANGMEVIFAENGKDGIDILRANPDVDLVLMDIMMPEMDGYQTMTAVREIPQFSRLPIISLTAKAMRGDREKSIASGASDYITKPVDTDQLLSLMRVWLYH
jgi:HAMP domain-containing protein/signal transduction histidine kinase/CheY-like chemotaxis protein